MRFRELYDAVVVGGGPSGSTVAQHIAAEGFKVLLVEEHEQVGHPNHCAGLVTPRTSTIAELPSDGLIHGASSHRHAFWRGMVTSTIRLDSSHARAAPSRVEGPAGGGCLGRPSRGAD